MFINAVGALLLAASARPADPNLTILEGVCDYPAGIGAPRAGEHRLPCDSIVIAPGKADADILVQFAMRKSGVPTGFAGEVDGHEMTVRRIYPQPGVMVSATGGHCKIFFSGAIVSGVSCVGNVGKQSYVGNFRAFLP